MPQNQKTDTKKSPTIRDKSDTDISKSDFESKKWRLEKSGKLINSQANKRMLWDELQHIKGQNILIKVRAGESHKTPYVLPMEKVAKFKSWLYRAKGITVIDDFEELRKKLDSDLNKTEFMESWRLQKDGKVISAANIKSKIWDELQNTAGQNILIQVEVGTRMIYVLPEENVAAFKQWLKEKKISVVEKKDAERRKFKTDITRSRFIQSWLLEKDGELIENYYDKAALWDDLLQQKESQGIFTKVVSCSHIVYVLSKENISAFNQFLAGKGIVVLDKRKKKFRDKHFSDILQQQFLKNWQLRCGGNILDSSEKRAIWKELENTEEQTILVKVQSGGNQTPYVLPADNIPLFEKWLSDQKNIAVLGQVRKKFYTDMTSKEFSYTWRLVRDKKIIGDKKEKLSPWKELENLGGENILIPVLNENKIFFVLPKENIPAFKQWLHSKKNITVLNAREKLYTDVDYRQFCTYWQLIKDNKKLTEENKQTLWNDLQNDEEQTILIKVLSGPNTPYVLPEENVSVFKKWLKEKGIIAFDPFDRILNLQEKAEQAQTATERNKYLVQAEKLFRRINPETTKQEIWQAYLEKITSQCK